jgi:hypothetical protein
LKPVSTLRVATVIAACVVAPPLLAAETPRASPGSAVPAPASAAPALDAPSTCGATAGHSRSRPGSTARSARTPLGLEQLGVFSAPADFKRAATFFTRACDAGDPGACTQLAYLYRSGQGVTRDTSRARKLYGQACGAGYSQACKELRSMPKTP